MNLATERWSRLLGSLATSVAVHLVILSATGLMAFRLLPQQEGSNHGHLTAVLLPPLPSSIQTRGIAESAPHSVVAPTPSGSDAPPTEPRPAEGTSVNISKLPPAANAAQTPGLLPGPWYYSARYLHRRPTPLKPIRPEYPKEEENTAGQVVLLMMINEQGTVDSYQVMESQPPGRFDDAVIEALSHETYAPGLIANYPVKSQLLVEIRFEPGSLPVANILPGLAPFLGDQAKPVPLVKQK